MRLHNLVILTFLAASLYTPAQPQNVEGKILIDVGHTSQDLQRILDALVRELEINFYTVEFTKTILYLDPYDVLVIAVPTQPFTSEELTSIHQFVDTGGGLFLMGESGILTSKNVENFNVLAGFYGIAFQRDVVVDPENNLTLDMPHPEIPIIDLFHDHPVTRNVQKIFLVSGCSVRLSKKAIPLAWGRESTYGDTLSEVYGYKGGTYDPLNEKRGKELVVMACAESGKGRVFALGDTSLFRGASATGPPWQQEPFQYFDHKRLALNVFSWLAVKSKIGRVTELLKEAQDLIQEGKYKEAQDVLDNVRTLSQEAEDAALMKQIAALRYNAGQGMEADRLFEEGKKKMEELNCEEASHYFEEATSLYEKIGNTKKVQECLTLLSECGDTAALMQKADLLVSEGRALLGQERYKEALQKVEEARTLYQELGRTENVGECNTLVEEIEKFQKEEQLQEKSLQRNRNILAGILVSTMVVIVAIYVWRRSTPREEVRPPHRYRRRER